MPLSTTALPSFDVLVDREFRHIAELLAPNKRARDEARGRIRTLLAMEAHVTETVEVSERDIDRIEKAIRTGTQVDQVFPRLGSSWSEVCAATGASRSTLLRLVKARQNTEA
ncbi:hypothetical protein D3C81_1585870 [compost metagenome]